MAFAALLAGFAPAAHAAAPERSATDDIRGLWVDHRDSDKHKVAVSIEDCDGLLCGRIYWLKKPTSGGAPKRDQHNPDAALRDRPLCGLKIMTGFRPGEGPSCTAGTSTTPMTAGRSTARSTWKATVRSRFVVSSACRSSARPSNGCVPPEPLERCR
jgi:hypothetical protein